jgi:transposase InsO family protein
MRFSFIDAKRAEFPVACLCEVLEVSQSGYFAWKSRPASEYQRKDTLLLAHVRERFRLSRETYGSPRMHADLRDDAITAGRHRIARLMRDNDLKVRQRRRFKKTTDSNHGRLVARTRSEMGHRYQLYLDRRRLALSRHCPRPLLTPYRRMGGQRPPEKRSGTFRLAEGAGLVRATGYWDDDRGRRLRRSAALGLIPRLSD